MSGGGRSKSTLSVAALVAALSLLFALFANPAPAFAADEAPAQWSLGDKDGTTRDTPAAVNVAGLEVTAVRGGGDDHIWYSVDGGPYTSLGGTTHTAPALAYAAFARSAFLVHTGADGHLWGTSFETITGPASSWQFSPNWTQIPNNGLPAGVQFREVRASLAASGSQLFIVAVGTDERIYHSTLNGNFTLGSPWSEVPGGGRTFSGITATTTPGNGGAVAPYLFIVQRGTDDRVYYMRFNMNFGIWDPSWAEVPGSYQTAVAPSATFHRAANGDDQVWISGASSANIPDYTWLNSQLPNSIHGTWQQAPRDAASASHGGDPLTASGPTLYQSSNGAVVMVLRWLLYASAVGWGNHPVQRKVT